MNTSKQKIKRDKKLLTFFTYINIADDIGLSAQLKNNLVDIIKKRKYFDEDCYKDELIMSLLGLTNKTWSDVYDVALCNAKIKILVLSN